MNDLVERQAVIDEIRFGQSYITKISSTGEIENLFVNENRALEDAVDRVMKLPSVTPTERTGHWTAEWFDAEGEERHYCSECGKWEYTESDFCPNCGARMDGDAE